MILSLKNRSTQEELMDDHELKGKKLQQVLEDLTTVNKWLGGNRVTIQGVEKLLEGKPKDKEISIADLGCGNGTVLRELAKWGRENGYKLKLVGMDANEHTIKVAQAECIEYKEIDLLPLNVLNSAFEKHRFDIITTTLTLHHFSDEEIERLLKKFVNQANYGVVINDLERNMKAYFLFMAFSSIFLKTKIARKDGLTSIQRGFKKEELEEFAKGVNAPKQEIKWFWAFRYQWLIFKNEHKDKAGK